MNSDLIFGNTSLLNAAQCGQVDAAYSTIVTLASAGPSAMSGSACGLVATSAGTARARVASAANGQAATMARRVTSKACSWTFERSALQLRVDALAELVKSLLALEHLAIDEEGRRRIDLQHFGGELLVGGDLVEQRLILQAIFHLLLGQAGLLADP